MRLAAVEIDLIAEVDRLLGADLDAGVATRAQVEVEDRGEIDLNAINEEEELVQ